MTSLFGWNDVVTFGFLIRLIVVLVIFLILVSLFETNMALLQLVKTPSWFVGNSVSGGILWFIFLIAFAWTWFQGARLCNHKVGIDLMFLITLVFIFCWIFSLLGSHDLGTSKYYILIAALVFFFGGLYLVKVSWILGLISVILSLFLFYVTGATFNATITTNTP